MYDLVSKLNEIPIRILNKIKNIIVYLNLISLLRATIIVLHKMQRIVRMTIEVIVHRVSFSENVAFVSREISR